MLFIFLAIILPLCANLDNQVLSSVQDTCELICNINGTLTCRHIEGRPRCICNHHKGYCRNLGNGRCEQIHIK